MDPIKLSTYRLAAECKYLKLKRTAFQDWFGEIMSLRYPDDYVRIRLSQGDGGLDGYRISSATVYQVYAPRDYYPSEIVSKMRKDFVLAEQTLAEKSLAMTEWVFVHNDPDDLADDVVTEFARLKKDNPAVTIRRWEFVAIWNEIKELREDELEMLFGSAPTIQHFEQLCYDDIIPIVEYLATQSPPLFASIELPSRKKLEYNRLSPELAEIIHRSRSKQGLASSYLSQLPEEDKPEKIAQAFRDKYAGLRDAGNDPDSIFRELWNFAGGQVFASDPKKLAGVMTILSYFFDSCDIFENAPESQ